jgi:uncharacterized membrane-anchored protein
LRAYENLRRCGFRSLESLMNVLQRWAWVSCLFAVLVLSWGSSAWAGDPKAPASSASHDDPGSPPGESPSSTASSLRVGPAELALPHEMRLRLPAGKVFLGQPEAGKLLERNGSLHNENLVGLVLPGPRDDHGDDDSVTSDGEENKPEDDWAIVMRFEPDGFVKDDEKPDGAEILKAIVEAEPEYNEERKKLGFGPIHAKSWMEPPRYEASTHRLVWALLVSSESLQTVNFNTRLLGRRGYLSVNLVTAPEVLDKVRGVSAEVVSNIEFMPGSRYEDFDASKDKVAEYGLTGLVLGGAGFGLLKIAKLGLLAKFGKLLVALLIAGKKGVVVVFAGLAALVRKWLGRGPRTPQVVDDTAASEQGNSGES